MCHIYALSKWQLQQLVPVIDRSKYYLHCKQAGIIGEFFKLEELQLNGKRGIFHLECPRDLLVRYKLVDRPVDPKHNVALGVTRFKSITPVLSVFELEHFCSHPLLNNF